MEISEEKIKDPKGMKAKILKCKGVLSLAPKKNVYTAVSILENIGVNIVDIKRFFTSLDIKIKGFERSLLLSS